MASPTPKRPRPPAPDPFARYPPRPPKTGPPDLVNLSFLVKAFAGTVAVAMVCAYLSVCLLVYIGGWHRLLRPSTAVDKTPATAGLPFESIRFDSAATGKPRLTGWWLPSDSATAPTVLFLHDGEGSLSTALPAIVLLHRAGVNIFAPDYRGFGQSDGPHPTQTQMQDDSAVALDYLLYTRHLPATKIVPYGLGLGGVLAARLAESHAELPALIVDQPRPDAYYEMVDAQQSRLLPMHLLVRDHFDIGSALAAVHQPKLLLAREPDARAPGKEHSLSDLFRAAPDPKTTVTTPSSKPLTDAEYLAALHRFLYESVR